MVEFPASSLLISCHPAGTALSPLITDDSRDFREFPANSLPSGRISRILGKIQRFLEIAAKGPLHISL